MSEQSGSGYPAAQPVLSNQPAPAKCASARLRQIKITASSRRAPPAIAARSTQRNETSNYEVDHHSSHQMNVGDAQRLSVAVVVNYKTLPDEETIASQQRTDEGNQDFDPRGDGLF
ncbi:flagellar M-ring protein FliF C-terminal domain-containing protein [Shigella flexneri]